MRRHLPSREENTISALLPLPALSAAGGWLIWSNGSAGSAVDSDDIWELTSSLFTSDDGTTAATYSQSRIQAYSSVIQKWSSLDYVGKITPKTGESRQDSLVWRSGPSQSRGCAGISSLTPPQSWSKSKPINHSALVSDARHYRTLKEPALTCRNCQTAWSLSELLLATLREQYSWYCRLCRARSSWSDISTSWLSLTTWLMDTDLVLGWAFENVIILPPNYKSRSKWSAG